MFPRRLMVPFIVAILSSCTAGRQAPEPPRTPSTASSLIPLARTGHVVAGADGTIWLVRTNSSTLEKWERGSAAAALRVDLPFAPLSMRATADGGIVASGAAGSVIVGPGGGVQSAGDATDLGAAGRLEKRREGLAFVSATGEAIVALPRGEVGTARLLGTGGAAALVFESEGQSLFTMRPDRPEARRIAGPFSEIDSFDVSPDGAEVVFSARRESGFDIGLVSVEGSEIQWIGPDPLDERTVRWAPRGNKVAYVIEAPLGAVIRSVHIPTGFQVSAPLPLTEVRDLSWEPEAERLALLVSSADAGERVELMQYEATERRILVPPAARGETPDRLGGVPEAVVFPPERLRYNEKLPLVVWASSEGPFSWNEGRARVQQNRRVGSVVVARGAAARPALWTAIGELPWVDPAQVFLVAPDAAAHPGDAVPAGIHLTVLTREGGFPEGSERVTVVRGTSGSLEEFAVLWLDERLRGFEREHDGN